MISVTSQTAQDKEIHIHVTAEKSKRWCGHATA